MKNTKSKSKSLRLVLSILIVIVIGLLTLGFYFAQDWLSTFAHSVGQTMAKSTISVTGAQSLTELQQTLDDKEYIITKLDHLIAPSQNYQSQIIDDLSKYATTNGITITDYNVASPAITNTTTSSTIGVGLSYITITIGNPVQMASLIKFFKLIETNLPKMQLTGINISGETSSTMVTVDDLTIGVYTK